MATKQGEMEKHSSPFEQDNFGKPSRSDAWILLTILIISACFLLAYSLQKAVWSDEVITFYTVVRPGFRELMHFQLTTPICLEPPTYEVILWAAGKLFGQTPFVFRLPAISAFLGMQAFLYFLVVRLGGRRAACLAALALLGMPVVNYGPEIRPYAFQLLCATSALWCWHRARTHLRYRILALLGLSLSIALAATSQFYGVFLALPVMAAECVLIARQRRPDYGVLAALTLGGMFVLADIPLLPSMHPFNESLGRSPIIGFSAIPETYLAGTLRSVHSGGHLQWRLIRLAVVVVVLAAMGLSFPSGLRRCADEHATALWAGFVTLVLIPAPVLLVAYGVTHTFAPRHALSSVVALVALLAVATVRMLRRISGLPLAVLAGACALLFAVHLISELREVGAAKAQAAQRAQPPDSLLDELAARPYEPVYLTIEECFNQSMIGPAKLRPHIRCLYSLQREKLYDHQAIGGLTLQALARNSSFPFPAATYDEMKQQGEVIVSNSPLPWQQWVGSSLRADNVVLIPLGTGLGTETKDGAVYRARFPK